MPESWTFLIFSGIPLEMGYYFGPQVFVGSNVSLCFQA